MEMVACPYARRYQDEWLGVAATADGCGILYRRAGKRARGKKERDASGSQRVAMRQGPEGQAGTVTYLHGDHLGSTSLTTDANGQKVARVLYCPYGEERYVEGTLSTDYGYTGQRSEAGFGLMDYNARYYDPYLNRFISPDSIVPDPANPQSLNRFSYVYSNPLKHTDPSGHNPCIKKGFGSQECLVYLVTTFGWEYEDVAEAQSTYNEAVETAVETAQDLVWYLPSSIGIAGESSAGWNVWYGERASAGASLIFNIPSGELSYAPGYGVSREISLWTKFFDVGGSLTPVIGWGYPNNDAMLGPSKNYSADAQVDEIVKLGLTAGRTDEADFDPRTGALVPAYNDVSRQVPKMYNLGVSGGTDANLIDLPVDASVSWGVSQTPWIMPWQLYRGTGQTKDILCFRGSPPSNLYATSRISEAGYAIIMKARFSPGTITHLTCVAFPGSRPENSQEVIPMVTVLRRYAPIAALVIMATSCGGSYFTRPVEANLSPLTLCQGWDNNGRPLAFPDVISTDETRICICGHLETNQDILLQISWDRERSSLLRNQQVFSDGPFLSCIESDEGFKPGNYGVSVVMYKTTLDLLEFSVGED
jgi:RHS repeat-associated protein